MANDDVERTEKPTAKKRNEARNKGQLAVSQELFTVANLMAVTLALMAISGGMAAQGMAAFRELWTPRDSLDFRQAGELLGVAFGAGAKVVLPILIASFIGGVLIGLIQTKGNIAREKLKPKLEKLNPIKNFSRIIKKEGLLNLGKAILKLCTVGVVVFIAVMRHIDDYPGLSQLQLITIISIIFSVIIEAYLIGSLMLLVIALGDYAFQYWRTEKGLKMSKQEVKDEAKQSEGDPMVRSRLRSMMFERQRENMLADVPNADVVVTNPTHVSVALLYKRSEMGAPTVVAKGRGVLARRIREIAEEHGVPILENPPLARALYRSVKIGQWIPERLYQAVAELLAYVYRLDRKKASAW